MKQKHSKNSPADTTNWIDVSVRLPGTTANVLTCNNFGAILIGAYDKKAKDWISEDGYYLGELNAKRSSPRFAIHFTPIVITHWMELPKPPKVGVKSVTQR